MSSFRLIDAVLTSGSRTAVEKLRHLDDKTFNQLQYEVIAGKRSIKTIEELVEEEKRVRTINYEKMIKDARKRFRPIDIEILRFLDDENGDSYYARGIRSEVSSEESPVAISTVLSHLRRLRKLGLVQLDRGLFDENDGMLAGSGWSVDHRRVSIVQRIVESLTDPDQTSIEDFIE